MGFLRNIFNWFHRPLTTTNWLSDIIFAIPRIFCGYLLAFSFGSDKFGMPWSPEERNLGFFEVIYWFPEDVKAYGGIFTMFPVFFAWMGAFSEAVGGLLWMIGLKTRAASFLILCTMLVAIFAQKGGQGIWSVLPAISFLWVALFTLVLGSGRFGLDYWITKKKDYFK